MQEKKRYTLPEYPPAEQAKATRPPIKADEAVLMGEATPQAIGRELARRGRDARLLAIRVANLEARPEPDRQEPGGASPPVEFVLRAARGVPLSEVRRRFRGPEWKGAKLRDALRAGIASHVLHAYERRTPAGRTQTIVGAIYLDVPKS